MNKIIQKIQSFLEKLLPNSFLKALKQKIFQKSNILSIRKQKSPFPLYLFCKRAVRMTAQNIWRNKSLALGTVFVLSLIVLIFNIIFALSFLTNTSIRQITQKVDILVWIKDESGHFEIEALKSDLKNLKEVKEVIFTSKEEALENFQKENREISIFLKQYSIQNPLPASLGIVTQNVEDNLKIMDFLKQNKYTGIIDQDKIKNNSEEKRRVEKIIGITQFVYKISNYLLTLFLIVLTLITLNLINMLIRRRSSEILIMRLVGAKHNFIRLPFILEGIFFLVLSFSLGLTLMYLLINRFKTELSATLSNDILSGLQNIVGVFMENFYTVLLYEILIAILIGISASYLAIEWHLQKRTLV